MRDRTRRRRLWGAVGATAAAVVLAGAPAALAQIESNWSGSAFDAPLVADADTTITTETFPISGVFGPNARITGVKVDFGRFVGGSYDPADEDECVPDDVGSVPDTSTTDDADKADSDPATYEFDVSSVREAGVAWPCNGRFVVRATATALTSPDPNNPNSEPEEKHALLATVTVAVPPPPVTEVETSVDEAADDITVTWVPLAESQLARDALGYRVERAGPDAGDGFAPIGARVGLDEEPSVVDHVTEAGTYHYRVRALRRGADGPVPSDPVPEGVASATVTAVPVTSTSRGPAQTQVHGENEAPGLPGFSAGRSRPAAPRTNRSGPPTTADTGYDGELDYGDRAGARSSSSELARGGEGQSIIRTEGGGVGLVAPAAGALVLAGWAGHLVYLNRLSKQF